MKINDLTASRLNAISKSEIRKIFDRAPKGSINMGLGEIQLPTPERINNFAKKILDSGYIPYTPNAGDPELIEAVQEYYKTDDIDVCITVGAEEAVFLTILGYVEKDDEVLIPDPGFVAYETIVRIAGGRAVRFKLDQDNNFRIDKDDLRSRINSNTKMIVLSNPSNPLGRSLREDEIDLLIDISDKHGIILLIDEIYRELFHSKRSSTFLGKSSKVIVVSGLSKSHCMTGWRIGWLAAQKSLIEPLIPFHQYICTCAPYISQKTAVFALSQEGWRIQDKIRQLLSGNFQFIKERFLQSNPEIEIVEPDASPYIFLKVENGADAVNNLNKSGIISIPGNAFGDNGTNWIRLSYGMNRDILENAVKRILASTL